MDQAKELLKAHPVRASRRQKKAFRLALLSYVRSLHYSAYVESGSLGGRNVVIGDPRTARYLICTHYDTCRNVPVPYMAAPCSLSGSLLALIRQCFLILLLPLVLTAVLLIFLDLPGDRYWIFPLLFLVSVLSLLFSKTNPFSLSHFDGSILTLLAVAAGLPVGQRKKVCFLLLDQGEQGFLGARSYVKSHKGDLQNQILLDLSGAGRGDVLVFSPGQSLQKDEQLLKSLLKLTGSYGTKQIRLCSTGFHFFFSDGTRFPRHIQAAALEKRGRHLCIRRDPGNPGVDEQNVNLLQAAVISLICCDAVK